MDNINTAIQAVIAAMQQLHFPNVSKTLPLMNNGALTKERFTVTEGDTIYLAGWTVTWRDASNDNERGLNVSDWACGLAIEGWRGFNGDPGQVQMNAWLQTLLKYLWEHVTLHQTVQQAAGIRLVNNEPRISFEQLCHYARIDVTALLIF